MKHVVIVEGILIEIKCKMLPIPSNSRIVNESLCFKFSYNMGEAMIRCVRSFVTANQVYHHKVMG